MPALVSARAGRQAPRGQRQPAARDHGGGRVLPGRVGAERRADVRRPRGADSTGPPWSADDAA